MTVSLKPVPGLREPPGRRWSKVHRNNMRKARLSSEWSLSNAQLGGVEFRDHPWCAAIQHYYLIAPYDLPSKQWAKFRAWMKERVDRARVFGG